MKSADEQTREDLDKAREQLRHALTESQKDAEKARERLRDREKRDGDKNDDSQVQ